MRRRRSSFRVKRAADRLNARMSFLPQRSRIRPWRRVEAPSRRDRRECPRSSQARKGWPSSSTRECPIRGRRSRRRGQPSRRQRVGERPGAALQQFSRTSPSRARFCFSCPYRRSGLLPTGDGDSAISRTRCPLPGRRASKASGTRATASAASSVLSTQHRRCRAVGRALPAPAAERGGLQTGRRQRQFSSDDLSSYSYRTMRGVAPQWQLHFHRPKECGQLRLRPPVVRPGVLNATREAGK